MKKKQTTRIYYSPNKCVLIKWTVNNYKKQGKIWIKLQQLLHIGFIVGAYKCLRNFINYRILICQIWTVLKIIPTSACSMRSFDLYRNTSLVYLQYAFLLVANSWILLPVDF